MNHTKVLKRAWHIVWRYPQAEEAAAAAGSPTTGVSTAQTGFHQGW
jgi:hypothetical protein